MLRRSEIAGKSRIFDAETAVDKKEKHNNVYKLERKLSPRDSHTLDATWLASLKLIHFIITDF